MSLLIHGEIWNTSYTLELTEKAMYGHTTWLGTEWSEGNMH